MASYQHELYMARVQKLGFTARKRFKTTIDDFLATHDRNEPMFIFKFELHLDKHLGILHEPSYAEWLLEHRHLFEE